MLVCRGESFRSWHDPDLQHPRRARPPTAALLPFEPECRPIGALPTRFHAALYDLV